MVTIRKKTINKRQYFYLEHSFKIDGKVKKRELYLGKQVPKNIERIKKSFIKDIYKDRYNRLDNIKKSFRKEFNNLPSLAKKKYIENFMIKFTYNSNRIEGSKITLKETARLLEDGISPKNRPLKDVKETEAHKKVFYHMLDYKKDLDLSIIMYWHKLLFKEAEPEIAGKIRKHNVAVAGSKAEFPFPAELEILLREFMRWYKKAKVHPVELAALAHLKFVSIHPFTDGNGRISRILMNFILNKNRFPMLDIHYANRDTYYTALERSQVKKTPHIFVQHIIKRYLKEYRRYT